MQIRELKIFLAPNRSNTRSCLTPLHLRVQYGSRSRVDAWNEDRFRGRHSLHPFTTFCPQMLTTMEIWILCWVATCIVRSQRLEYMTVAMVSSCETTAMGRLPPYPR